MAWRRRWSWVGTRERKKVERGWVGAIVVFASRRVEKGAMTSWPPEVKTRRNCIRPLT